jgi:hypothetical protein
MSDVSLLAKERLEIFKDLYSGNVPTRVPVVNPMNLEAMFEYTGDNPAEMLWDMNRAETVFSKVCTDFAADTVPGGTRRYPSFYQILGYKACIMSSNGHMQAPEVIPMEVEDYDYLISSPLDCLVERMLPRLCSEFDTTPEIRSLVLAKAYRAWADEMATAGALGAKMREKFGFPAIGASQSLAQFDCFSDILRGFNGISLDLRRIPEKVLAACNALTPLMIKRGYIPNPMRAEINVTMIPLHMAPYLRTKDAEKHFFPPLYDLVNALNEMGHNVELSLQVKYDRYIDCLQELPANTILNGEQSDDLKGFKEKLGKKFIIKGFYPVALLMTGTKEQCIDKAKEMLDIFAPGGGYLFGFDKGVLNLPGNSAENLRAVMEYVYNNGKYSEVERAGNKEFKPMPDNSSEVLSKAEAKINSKYFTSWEDYKEKHPELYPGIDDVIRQKIMKYEDGMFSFIMNKIS